MRRGIAAATALLGFLLLAPTANATFHLNQIREIRVAADQTPFIEIQAYAGAQGFLSGHVVTMYQADGDLIMGNTVNLSNVDNFANQDTLLIAPGPVDGVMPDVTNSLGFSTTGGAVCFDNIDCVAYGTFTDPGGNLTSPAGTPVAAYGASNPEPRSLTRRITGGSCATALDAGDDTNDSTADFEITTTPTPQNSSTTPSETVCDIDPPETKIKKAPKGKIDETTVKVKFNADEPNSTFECKFDRKKFKPCTSPKKLKNLDDGKHKFRVRATDEAGNTDPSPAKAKFKVVD